MNQAVANKLRKGIAIALKQYPWLRSYNERSGIYLWDRYDENGIYCWYIGKAKNLLRRTAQHIVDGQSHLDKSIKAHGLTNSLLNCQGSNLGKWSIDVLEMCDEENLDVRERFWIAKWQKRFPNSKTYNIESGGTTGKTIIGEKKQRRDIKWKAEARAKVLTEFREYFDIVPKDNAIKGKDELKVRAEALQQEYYNGQVSYDNDYWKVKRFLKEHGFNGLDEVITRWENEF